ncbi:Csu type fimbrial protein [Salinicola rhizosphaerae]|uniref:Protein CsuE n=1 Tax=Salinicola rhizosphaerae TaxID=1443141 RepID=A0ABQ3DRK4_9GAMM|nr:spore coat U domain-containing protein [Salinicola rhizosphaerae]GHB13275.1 protein CsuE [Salinicola rhizosphaerae]
MTTRSRSGWRLATRALALLAGFAACLLLSRPGWACSVVTANPSASFGSVTSLVVGTTQQQTQALPSAGLRCPGSTLGLIVTGDRVNATVSSANGAGLRNSAGDTIGYTIFADAAGQAQITPGTAYNYYNSYILGLLGLLGGQAANLPMYFRTQPGSAGNVSAGTYTDTLTVSWNWSICTGIGVAGVCLGRNSGTATTVISLSLTISPDCAIDAPSLDFGSAPLVSGFDAVTQTISIRCTKGSSYTVGINDGLNASGTQRRMAAGGNFLAYEIYQGASSQTRWGSSGSARRSSATADLQPGNTDGVSWQGFTYRAEILPAQATPPPATYTDTLVVDVAF